MADEKLAEVLQQPINPDLDYFDATASILKLTETVEQLNSRIEALEKVLNVQADINGKLLDGYRQFSEFMLDQQKPKSAIIMPDRVN